jgi:hypothetical protein
MLSLNIFDMRVKVHGGAGVSSNEVAVSTRGRRGAASMSDGSAMSANI